MPTRSRSSARSATPRTTRWRERHARLVNHERHYTLEQANAALPFVTERVEQLRAARLQLDDEEARAALNEAAPANGGGAPGRVVSEAFLALQRTLGELQAMEIVLRDLERGLVDFPALRDGREIYLCWEEGEEEIGFWPEEAAGHAGPQPL